MSVKYKSRRKSVSKRNITKRQKKHRVLNKHKRNNHHNLRAIQNHEEHDGNEKMAFDTKQEHYNKINLILSNFENKKHGKHGTKKTNYRNLH